MDDSLESSNFKWLASIEEKSEILFNFSADATFSIWSQLEHENGSWMASVGCNPHKILLFQEQAM